MRLASYNIRFDSRPDDITVQQSLKSLKDPLQEPVYQDTTTEQPWSTRRVRIAEQLLKDRVDVVGELNGMFDQIYMLIHFKGLQEVLSRQAHDLAGLLGEDWSWVHCYLNCASEMQ
jgi:hypothetical protein